MPKKVLVTGAAGFLGSHIVERLVQDGRMVVALDDLSTGLSDNLDGVRKSIDFVHGSIADEMLLDEVMDDIDTIYHMAGAVGVNLVCGRDEDVWAINYAGTRKVLDAAVKHGVQRFLFASTSEVYGHYDPVRLPMREDDDFAPDTPYGEAKLAAEQLVINHANDYGMQCVAARYFNVYGPRQTLNGYCVPHFIDAALKDVAILIHGDGSQTRDLTYVDDAVQLTMALLGENVLEASRGKSFNIGTGSNVPMIDLAKQIVEITGSKSPITYGPKRRPTDGYHKMGDPTRIVSVTGLKPAVSLEEGLERTVGASVERLQSGAMQESRTAMTLSMPRTTHASLQRHGGMDLNPD